MKKTFLKAVTAAAVVAATVALSSVAVFAAQTTTVWTPDQPQDWVSFEDGGKSKKWELSTTTEDKVTASFEKEIFTTSSGNTGDVKNQKNMMCNDGGNVMAITTNADNAELTIYAVRQGGSGSKLKANGSEVANILSERSTTPVPAITFTIEKAGTTQYTFANSKIQIYRLELKDEPALTESYTITAKDLINNSDISDFTVKGVDNVAVSPSDGAYTLKVGKTYTISADGYNNETITTVSGENTISLYMLPSDTPSSKLTMSEITNTEKNGYVTYDTNVNKFYVQEQVRNSSNRIQIATGANIEFNLTTPGKVVLTGTAASGDSSDRFVVVDKVGGNNVFTSGKLATKEKETFEIAITEAGTYKIAGSGGSVNIDEITVYGTLEEIPVTEKILKSTDGKVAVVKLLGTYAVAVIPANTAKTSTAVNLNEQPFDTVYESIQIGDKTFSATDLGGSAGDYLLGVKTEVNNNTSNYKEAATDIQGSITVTYTEAA